MTKIRRVVVTQFISQAYGSLHILSYGTENKIETIDSGGSTDCRFTSFRKAVTVSTFQH